MLNRIACTTKSAKGDFAKRKDQKLIITGVAIIIIAIIQSTVLSFLLSLSAGSRLASGSFCKLSFARICSLDIYPANFEQD